MINKIKDKILSILSVLLVLYFIFNLLGGNRGLFSNYEKKVDLKNYEKEKINLIKEIKYLEKFNSLLSDEIDVDYIEILLRDKFLLGKKGETIYIRSNE